MYHHRNNFHFLIVKAATNEALSPSANNNNNQYNSSVYDKQKNYQLSPNQTNQQQQQQALANDLTQIKYLKNNYNIQYYPSDFVNFSQQASEAVSPNSTSNKQLTPSDAILINQKQQQQRQMNQKPSRSSDFLINQHSPNSNNKSKGTNPNLLMATTTKPTSNSSTTSTSSTSSSSSKLLGSNVQNGMNLHEELSLATGGGSSSQKSQRTSLKLSKLTNGLTNSAITSPTSEVMTNEALNSASMQHNFHQQIAELQSNLKSVKSLTNLYESKQLSVSPPTNSPNASSSGTLQK